jgi:hypothetical protein
MEEEHEGAVAGEAPAMNGERERMLPPSLLIWKDMEIKRAGERFEAASTEG